MDYEVDLSDPQPYVTRGTIRTSSLGHSKSGDKFIAVVFDLDDGSSITDRIYLDGKLKGVGRRKLEKLGYKPGQAVNDGNLFGRSISLVMCEHPEYGLQVDMKANADGFSKGYGSDVKIPEQVTPDADAPF